MQFFNEPTKEGIKKLLHNSCCHFYNIVTDHMGLSDSKPDITLKNSLTLKLWRVVNKKSAEMAFPGFTSKCDGKCIRKRITDVDTRKERKRDKSQSDIFYIQLICKYYLVRYNDGLWSMFGCSLDNSPHLKNVKLHNVYKLAYNVLVLSLETHDEVITQISYKEYDRVKISKDKPISCTCSDHAYIVGDNVLRATNNICFNTLDGIVRIHKDIVSRRINENYEFYKII